MNTFSPARPLAVLVPAYEPDHRLVELIDALQIVAPDRPIVVVDDGSGPAYAALFEACRARHCDVITHPINRGKGAALKTGFAWIVDRHPRHDVVCVDCDGQHRPADVANVAAALRDHRRGPVLGVRAFSGDVPLRSRIGNGLTRQVFRLATGLRVVDTQTGLRCYPASILPWLLEVPGQKFEYELETLLDAQRRGMELVQVPIATVYLDDNESSHFRPVRDSIRVYLPFLKFWLSSLGAFAVDLVAFLVSMALTHSLVVSVVGARLVSATTNYLVNRNLVFRSTATHRRALTRYASLAVALLAMNYGMLRALTGLGTPLLVAKLATEATLAFVSYRSQQRRVFGSTLHPLPEDQPLVGAGAGETHRSR